VTAQIRLIQHTLEVLHPPEIADRDQHAAWARMKTGRHLRLVIEIELLESFFSPDPYAAG